MFVRGNRISWCRGRLQLQLSNKLVESTLVLVNSLLGHWLDVLPRLNLIQREGIHRMGTPSHTACRDEEERSVATRLHTINRKHSQ